MGCFQFLFASNKPMTDGSGFVKKGLENETAKFQVMCQKFLAYPLSSNPNVLACRVVDSGCGHLRMRFEPFCCILLLFDFRADLGCPFNLHRSLKRYAFLLIAFCSSSLSV